ncbi:MAG: hypothetical protein GF398_14135 [Chitinivibrionales bacterium]|nr:hypothetical protein [Chitinivibrionales bacterium]
MREIRSILHYRLEKGISADRTALALKLSKGTVINTLERFKQSDLKWPLPSDMSDSALEHALYPPKSKRSSVAATELPSMSHIEKELAKKHVTLQCLYDEYCHSSPEVLPGT